MTANFPKNTAISFALILDTRSSPADEIGILPVLSIRVLLYVLSFTPYTLAQAEKLMAECPAPGIR